jgi:23S rRNA (guanosine2251-2'-O)-methyltransferase
MATSKSNPGGKKPRQKSPGTRSSSKKSGKPPAKRPAAKKPGSKQAASKQSRSTSPGRGAPSRGRSSNSSNRGSSKRGAPKRGPRGGSGSRKSAAPAKGANYERGSTKRKDDLDGTQIEGRHAVRELLLAGRRRVREVMVLSDGDGEREADDIEELCHELHIAVRPLTRRQFDEQRRTDAPQGVIARAEAIAAVDLMSLTKTSRKSPPPFLLALDGVTDPGNLGALIRSAECAGVSGLILARHRAVHITPTVAKAAAGAVEHLPMALVAGLPTALAELKERGVWTVGLDAGAPTSLHDLTLGTEPICLVLGAEGRGLGRLVADRCDSVVSIPLRGTLGSLNVSVAGALGCFEVVRQRS